MVFLAPTLTLYQIRVWVCHWQLTLDTVTVTLYFIVWQNLIFKTIRRLLRSWRKLDQDWFEYTTVTPNMLTQRKWVVYMYIQIQINNTMDAAHCADIAQQTENDNAANSWKLTSVATFRYITNTNAPLHDSSINWIAFAFYIVSKLSYIYCAFSSVASIPSFESSLQNHCSMETAILSSIEEMWFSLGRCHQGE